MSDCRNGGRNVYRIPEEREPGVLYDHGQPNYDYLQARAIVIGGVRFERVRECENASRYAGEFKCSECGAAWKTEDMDLVEPTLWVDGVADYPSYCQHCGARVKEGGDD